MVVPLLDISQNGSGGGRVPYTPGIVGSECLLLLRVLPPHLANSYLMPPTSMEQAVCGSKSSQDWGVQADNPAQV